jgi:hypothetical protein
VNCLDCHDDDDDRLAAPAVAACSDCGAGACRHHAAVRSRTVNRVGVMGRLDPVDPPARSVRCRVCDATHVALHNGPARSRGAR